MCASVSVFYRIDSVVYHVPLSGCDLPDTVMITISVYDCSEKILPVLARDHIRTFYNS